jgi:quercetin dioxygenase-like cupin family protein
MITRRQAMKTLALGSTVLAADFFQGFGMAQTVAQKSETTPGVVTAANGVTVRQVLTQPLEGMDDKVAAIVTVEYAPGAASKPHRHPGPVFGYVLEGSVVIQVDPDNPVTYSQGQMWYEPAMHVHRVSRNASETEPAKILAFLIVEKGQPITVPEKPTAKVTIRRVD